MRVSAEFIHSFTLPTNTYHGNPWGDKGECEKGMAPDSNDDPGQQPVYILPSFVDAESKDGWSGRRNNVHQAVKENNWLVINYYQ